MSAIEPHRRSLLLAALTLATLGAASAVAEPRDSGLSADDQALVDKAAAYLNGITEAKSRFIQTDPRGAVTQGELFLSRPGRARFAYDPPYGLLIVSDGRTVWINDPRLRTVNKHSLSSTPLALFLSDHVRLDHGVIVDHVERFSDGFTLFARDGHHLAQGRLALTFSQSPMRLIEWAISNDRGGTTVVRLLDLAPTSGLDPALFVGGGAG